MKNKSPQHKSPYLWRIIPIFSGLALSSAFALNIEAQDDSTDNNYEEAYELSPFVVETSEDMGYLATNTLAGSRINAELKDTAASISAYTLEFLEDLSATDLEQVMDYSVSAESSFGDTGQNPGGNNNVDAAPSYQFRLRGFNASRSRNYFRWDLTVDTYNTERLDESRGPNSLLFGVGSAGGIINLSTKQALFGKDFLKTELKVGSWDRYRGSFDLNRELIEGKLAIRLNAMYEDNESWMRHVTETDMRIHATATYRALENTSIRVEVEKGSIDDVVARPFQIFDEYSQWDGNLFDKSTWIDEPGARRSQWWGGTLPRFIGNDGTVVDVISQMETENYVNSVAEIGGYSPWWNAATSSTSVLSGSIVPLDVSTSGPGASRDHDFLTYSAFLEQKLFDSLYIELAAHHVESDWVSHWTSMGQLRIDPNVYRQNGDVNPYAGRYYLEGQWDRRTQERDTDSLRLTASYELDLQKFGRHNLVGMLSQDKENLAFTNEFEAITSPSIINPNGDYAPAWGATPDNARYLVTRRQYVTLGDWDNFHIPSWETPISGVSYVSKNGNYNGGEITTGWIPRGTSQNDDEVDTNTLMLAAQSYFLNDRIVTTLGYRRDKVENTTHAVTRNERGYYAIDYDQPIMSEFTSETKTLGVVGHVSDSFSVFYNRSDNTDFPNFLIKVLPEDLTRPFDGVTPNPAEGIGWDTGIIYSLLDGRISGRVTYFQADVKNVENWSYGWNVTKSTPDAINNGLRDAGVIDQDMVDFRTHTTTGTLFDEESEGVEFSMTANITDNWRLTMNYSYTDRNRINAYADAEKLLVDTRDWALSVAGDYIAANGLDVAPEDFLLGKAPADGEPDHRSTIGERIAEWQSDMNFYKRGEEVKRGLRKNKFNVFSAYDFKDGRLKGMTLGGGVRYQSANIVGVDSDGKVLEGDENFYVDLLFRYRFGKKLLPFANTSIQINVRNLLDDTDAIPLRYSPVHKQNYSDASIVDRATFRTPREIIVSLKAEF